MQTNEKKQISAVAKFFVALLAILLTLSLIVCLVNLTLSRTLFSTEFYKNILVEQKTYQKLPQVLSAQIIQTGTSSDNVLLSVLSQLPQAQLDGWISSVLTEDYVQGQTDHLLDSLLNFINLRSFSVDLNFDLAPVKANLAGEQSQTALVALLNSLPDCTQDQLNSLTSTFMSQGNLNGAEIQLCKPGEPLFSIIQGVISSALTSMSQTLPDQYTVGGEQLQQQLSNFVLSRQYRTYYMVKKGLDYSPWICLALALLILLFTLRSAKSLLSALGIPLLIAGIVGLIGAALVYASLFFLQTMPFFAGLSGQISGLLIPVVHSVISTVSLTGALFAGGAFLLGLILTIVAGKAQA